MLIRHQHIRETLPQTVVIIVGLTVIDGESLGTLDIVITATLNNKPAQIIKLKQIIVSNSIVDLPAPKKFYMVKQILTEFELEEFNIKKTEVDLEENYNADLFELSNKMVSFINNNEANGMVLLHGLPGSGKTTYLRHLISVCKARFIYLPNNLFKSNRF